MSIGLPVSLLGPATVAVDPSTDPVEEGSSGDNDDIEDTIRVGGRRLKEGLLATSRFFGPGCHCSE